LFDKGSTRVHANLGASFPTGSIDERDDIPVMNNAILPYPMQIGSGSYQFLPGLTAVRQFERGSIGGQLSAKLLIGENDRDYTVGDRFSVTAWGARSLSKAFSLSGRFTYDRAEAYDGADPALNPNMVPTADPRTREGQRIDAGLGANLLLGSGHRLALELELPVLQDLEGPQLETDLTLTLGWQKRW
jgi:hypothetical protein